MVARRHSNVQHAIALGWRRIEHSCAPCTRQILTRPVSETVIVLLYGLLAAEGGAKGEGVMHRAKGGAVARAIPNEARDVIICGGRSHSAVRIDDCRLGPDPSGGALVIRTHV